jgi:hypothetical protein
MYINFKEKPKLYTLLLNANSHNPIISFIYCFKSVIKRPKKKVGMLKFQLITVIDFKYKIKITFFFTEGLFLSTSYTSIYMISIIWKKHNTILLNHWISEIIIKTTFNNILKEGTYKVRKEIETKRKRNEINKNEKVWRPDGQTNERTAEALYTPIFFGDVYKSYQKLTLEIFKKPTYLVKVPFFPLIPFHLKKPPNFFLILQDRTIGFEIKSL